MREYNILQIWRHLNSLLYVFKILTKSFRYLLMCLKATGWVTNKVYADQTPRSMASDPVPLFPQACPNIKG